MENIKSINFIIKILSNAFMTKVFFGGTIILGAISILVPKKYLEAINLNKFFDNYGTLIVVVCVFCFVSLIINYVSKAIEVIKQKNKARKEERQLLNNVEGMFILHWLAKPQGNKILSSVDPTVKMLLGKKLIRKGYQATSWTRNDPTKPFHYNLTQKGKDFITKYDEI